MSHFPLLKGIMIHNALSTGHYNDIAQEGGFQLSFDPHFDL